MNFPRTKSWVHVVWRLFDPDAQVAEMAAELSLQVTGNAALIDLGASSTVYAALRGDQSAIDVGTVGSNLAG